MSLPQRLKRVMTKIKTNDWYAPPIFPQDSQATPTRHDVTPSDSLDAINQINKRMDALEKNFDKFSAQYKEE